jgi:hypothetical protein
MPKHLAVRALVVASLLVVAAGAIIGKSAVEFRIRDDCDPATFNAAIGPGTCVETFDGGTTFDEFLEELGEDKDVGAWRFNPDETRVDRGQGTILASRSGEFHTFTKVKAFGGGIVGLLNQVGGFGATSPECGEENVLAAPTDTNIFVPAGAPAHGPTGGSAQLPKGKTKWQCCIHPWMRSEITVR